MIERVTIDGEEAFAAYLNNDFEPVPKEDASLVKLVFDDGRVMFVYPQGDGEDGAPATHREQDG